MWFLFVTCSTFQNILLSQIALRVCRVMCVCVAQAPSLTRAQPFLFTACIRSSYRNDVGNSWNVNFRERATDGTLGEQGYVSETTRRHRVPGCTENQLSSDNDLNIKSTIISADIQTSSNMSICAFSVKWVKIQRAKHYVSLDFLETLNGCFLLKQCSFCLETLQKRILV